MVVTGELRGASTPAQIGDNQPDAPVPNPPSRAGEVIAIPIADGCLVCENAAVVRKEMAEVNVRMLQAAATDLPDAGAMQCSAADRKQPSGSLAQNSDPRQAGNCNRARLTCNTQKSSVSRVVALTAVGSGVRSATLSCRAGWVEIKGDEEGVQRFSGPTSRCSAL